MDIDPMTGLKTYFVWDATEEKWSMEYVHDVEPCIEENKALANTDYSANGRKANWWHVAQIPVGVQLKWLKEYGVDLMDKNHWPRVKRLLNDPEWRYLRTGGGRV